MILFSVLLTSQARRCENSKPEAKAARRMKRKNNRNVFDKKWTRRIYKALAKRTGKKAKVDAGWTCVETCGCQTDSQVRKSQKKKKKMYCAFLVSKFKTSFQTCHFSIQIFNPVIKAWSSSIQIWYPSQFRFLIRKSNFLFTPDNSDTLDPSFQLASTWIQERIIWKKTHSVTWICISWDKAHYHAE